MSRITVKLKVMAEVENDYRLVHQALCRELDDLEKKLNKHLQDWSGDAQHAYKTAHDEWQDSAKKRAATLKWLHRALVTAHKNYHSAHGASRKTWKVP